MKYQKDKYILNINDLSKLKEVYIYGTGISSQKLKELIKRNSIDIKILGFVDSYKKTTIIDNLKIYNIKDFKEYCLKPAIEGRENILSQLRIIDEEKLISL